MRLVILALLLVSASLGGWAGWERFYVLPHQLAQARATLGTPQAGSLLEELVKKHPDDLTILALDAEQLRREGKPGKGLTRLQQAAERGWPVEQVNRQRALLLAQADFSQAEGLLQAQLDVDPHDPDTLLALAFGYGRQGQMHMAELLANRVVETNPENGAALCIRGGIHLEERHLGQARDDLEKALRLGQGQYYAADARILLANCLLEQGDFENALTYFRQARADEPANLRVLFGLGRSAMLLKQWDEAREAFQAVLELRPGHLESLLHLAYIYEEQGDLNRALELLEEANRQDPKRDEVYLRMAKILHTLGQPERAAQCQARYEELHNSKGP